MKPAAIATETRRAETTQIGSVVDEGAGRQASPTDRIAQVCLDMLDRQATRNIRILTGEEHD